MRVVGVIGVEGAICNLLVPPYRTLGNLACTYFGSINSLRGGILISYINYSSASLQLYKFSSGWDPVSFFLRVLCLETFLLIFFQKKFFQNFQVVPFTPPRLSESADIFVQLSSADSPRKRETKKLLFDISQIIIIRSNIFCQRGRHGKCF